VTGGGGVKIWTTDGVLRATVLRGLGAAGVNLPGVFASDSRSFVIASAFGLHEVSLAPPYATRNIEVNRDGYRWPVPVVALRNGVVVEARGKGNSIAFVPLDAPERAVIRAMPEGFELAGVKSAQNRLVVIAKDEKSARPYRVWLYEIDRPDAAPYLIVKARTVGGPTISPNGRYLALNVGYKLVLYDLDKREKLWAVGTELNSASPVGFAVGSRWLFAAQGKLGDQVSFDVETGSERWRDPRVPGRQGAWLRAVSSRGFLVVAREGDRIELQDLDLRHVAYLGFPRMYGWDSVPNELETSPDGRWVAIAHRNRLHLWDIERRVPTYLVDPELNQN
jgi:hypothetical protein